MRATPGERAAALPGDALVSADVVMDRAFTLAAPPARVWPWVVQLGKNRAGWYLPRSVEHLVPRARRALRRIEPELQRLGVGDVIPDWGGADATFTVAEIEPGSHLLFTSTRGRMHLTWCIRLTAAAGDRTRVHLRLRLGPVKHRRVAHTLGGLVDLATIAGLAAGLEERVSS
ncbi:SRPBCC family protein [Terrabacter terrigena]|uniref:SRPBCC family protein n=1 Tax=Terrabacter terrigena TaxID=574718 RepID=A0ABW3MYC3_9MICO